MNLPALLKESPLPSRFEMFDPQRDSPLCDRLVRLAATPRMGIIFDDDLFYVHLCSWYPEIMLDIIQAHRVMVMRHVVLDGFQPTGVVDSLIFSWRQLARRIAMDLSQGKGAIPALQTAFQADWRGQTPLSEMMQSGPMQ